MKRGFLVFLGLMMPSIMMAQHLFEHTYPVVTEEQPQIRTLMNNVSKDSLEATIQHLQDYHTRQWNSQMVYEVQDWIYEAYRDMGFDSVYLHDFPVHYHDSLFETSDNVIAIKRGTLYPDEYVVCGAHYDSFNMNGGDPDSLRAPGADDNASGTAGIMETARLLAPCSFERSVIFCHFAAEEIGLIGSAAYAKDCADQRLDIVGYFNLDMIGYLEEGSDIHVNLLYTGRDSLLANYVFDFSETYYPEMRIWRDWLSPGADSDYSSFNRNGYAAVHPFEDTHHSSPFIHTPSDILGQSVNSMDQVKRFTELNLGLVATLAGLVSNSVDDMADGEVVIAPNPAHSEMRVTTAEPMEEVRVYDLLGACLLTMPTNTNAVTVNTSAFSNGIYFLSVRHKNGVRRTHRFIVNH